MDAAGKPVTLNVSTVRATNLNVRGGAGEQFPVLAKMPRGSQLVLTGASKGKWMEVLARKTPRCLSPPNSSRANKPVWVSWKSRPFLPLPPRPWYPPR